MNKLKFIINISIIIYYFKQIINIIIYLIIIYNIYIIVYIYI